eukprot:scaffold40600_cov62-Phaeocystis_antarctica.AAC.1
MPPFRPALTHQAKRFHCSVCASLSAPTGAAPLVCWGQLDGRAQEGLQHNVGGPEPRRGVDDQRLASELVRVMVGQHRSELGGADPRRCVEVMRLQAAAVDDEGVARRPRREHPRVHRVMHRHPPLDKRVCVREGFRWELRDVEDDRRLCRRPGAQQEVGRQDAVSVRRAGKQVARAPPPDRLLEPPPRLPRVALLGRQEGAQQKPLACRLLDVARPRQLDTPQLLLGSTDVWQRALQLEDSVLRRIQRTALWYHLIMHTRSSSSRKPAKGHRAELRV